MIDTSKLLNWLTHDWRVSDGEHYTHRVLTEVPESRCVVIADLRALVDAAHEDCRRHLRLLAGVSLDPLGTPQPDPAGGYPQQLEFTCLQGYFGEVFAGIVAESFEHFGDTGWKVPAYLFRFHNLAFDVLERWRQTGQQPGIIPGRTGDDCLAFTIDKGGEIGRVLVCEAKCVRDHDASAIAEACRKVSEANPKPVEILRLIEIMQDYQDADHVQWVSRLQRLYFTDLGSRFERCDLISYVCGRPPRRRPTWIPEDRPHDAYEGERAFEAVETYLDGVEALIREVYSLEGPENVKRAT
jgi:hypothetical protein